MATTSIADVWEPDLWVEGTLEKENSFAHLLNSSAVHDNERLETFANGAGSTINMPFLSDISDQEDDVQREGVEITAQKHTSGRPRATILEREYGYSNTALSKQRSGTDPIGAMMSQLTLGRLKRRQRAMLAMLRGVFGETGDGALFENSTEDFSESIAGQTGDHLIDADKILSINNGFGELVIESDESVIWAHPDIITALRLLDENSFKTTSTDGGLTINTYKDVPIYSSKMLMRAGTTDGVVYDTYVIAGELIGYGAKPQQGDVIDVASLQYDPKKGTNTEQVNDRTRYSLHIDGMSYDGTPTDESPTNAELQVEDDWSLKYGSAELVRAARIRTNG